MGSTLECAVEESLKELNAELWETLEHGLEHPGEAAFKSEFFFLPLLEEGRGVGVRSD
jgi:hypothetical protein